MSVPGSEGGRPYTFPGVEAPGSTADGTGGLLDPLVESAIETDLAGPMRDSASEPNPLGLVPIAEAAQMPLLAVSRGSGRVVLYEPFGKSLGIHSLEGEWAIVGDCGARLRVGLGFTVVAAGQVRAVGRIAEGPSAPIGLVVPAHACAEATRSWHFARSPTPAEVASVAGAPKSGTYTVEQVLPGDSTVHWLVVGDGDERTVIEVRSGPAIRVAGTVSRTDAEVVGSFLTGGRWEAWLVDGSDASGRRLLRFVVGSLEPLVAELGG